MCRDCLFAILRSLFLRSVVVVLLTGVEVFMEVVDFTTLVVRGILTVLASLVAVAR